MQDHAPRSPALCGDRFCLSHFTYKELRHGSDLRSPQPNLKPEHTASLIPLVTLQRASQTASPGGLKDSETGASSCERTGCFPKSSPRMGAQVAGPAARGWWSHSKPPRASAATETGASSGRGKGRGRLERSAAPCGQPAAHPAGV